jgi:hypothetical protein
MICASARALGPTPAAICAPPSEVWKMVPCSRVFQPEAVLARSATSIAGSWAETWRVVVLLSLL